MLGGRRAMRDDWIDALVRQGQARAQRAREAAARWAEEDQRERAACEQHFDQVWSCLGDACRHAVDRYNAAVGVMHEVEFQVAPRGAMLIAKAALPRWLPLSDRESGETGLPRRTPVPAFRGGRGGEAHR